MREVSTRKSGYSKWKKRCLTGCLFPRKGRPSKLRYKPSIFAGLSYKLIGNLPLCLAFGTGEGLLWYGICARCKKQAPVVRGAFSGAPGVKNRLLWYGSDIRYRNPLLWYGADIRCAEQPPVVRDAFSETFGDKKGLLWYATHLQRCAKQPPAPPNAFSKAQKRHPATLNASSKARRTADSTDCGQPPAAPDAFSEACRAKSSTCPPDAASVRETPTARR